MTWARRVDTTHAEIVRALRACGWLVFDLSRVPNFVDVIALRAGVLRLVEIKSPRGALRPSQQALIDQGWPIVVLRSAADAARME